jgi:hypothetical protein
MNELPECTRTEAILADMTGVTLVGTLLVAAGAASCALQQSAEE